MFRPAVFFRPSAAQHGETYHDWRTHLRSKDSWMHEKCVGDSWMNEKCLMQSNPWVADGLQTHMFYAYCCTLCFF